ncbi:hypothetical protein D3C71_1319880 [compost metagenome]
MAQSDRTEFRIGRKTHQRIVKLCIQRSLTPAVNNRMVTNQTYTTPTLFQTENQQSEQAGFIKTERLILILFQRFPDKSLLS